MGDVLSAYLFIYHIGDMDFWEAGHRSSTVIHLDEPIKDASDDDLVTTTAHDFSMPECQTDHGGPALGPFDYTQPNPNRHRCGGRKALRTTMPISYPFVAGLRSIDWFLKHQADGTLCWTVRPVVSAFLESQS